MPTSKNTNPKKPISKTAKKTNISPSFATELNILPAISWTVLGTPLFSALTYFLDRKPYASKSKSKSKGENKQPAIAMEQLQQPVSASLKQKILNRLNQLLLTDVPKRLRHEITNVKQFILDHDFLTYIMLYDIINKMSRGSWLLNWVISTMASNLLKTFASKRTKSKRSKSKRSKKALT